MGSGGHAGQSRRPELPPKAGKWQGATPASEAGATCPLLPACKTISPHLPAQGLEPRTVLLDELSSPFILSALSKERCLAGLAFPLCKIALALFKSTSELYNVKH